MNPRKASGSFIFLVHNFMRFLVNVNICFVFFYKKRNKKLDKYAKLMYSIIEEISEYMVYSVMMSDTGGFSFMQRFFVDSSAYSGNIVTISGKDAFHISRSLRMKKGEMISVCLSDGTLLYCELKSFSCDEVLAEVVSKEKCVSESPVKIRVYIALPKGDKLDAVVQKTVECGAYSVTPFMSERCIAKAGDSFDKKLERLNRIAYEAAKQCGRGIVPEVKPILTYEKMLDEALDSDLPLFCYEAAGTLPLGQLLKKGVKEISVIVGSEGGFSEKEAMLAKEKGLLLTGLGQRILRCETAPTFVLSCLSLYYELGI